MLKTPKKMFTITFLIAGGEDSYVVNLKLKNNKEKTLNRWEGL